MAQKNRANMLTDIVTNIFNNIINYITGQNAQDRFVNLLDSTPNILSDKDQADGYVGTDVNNEMVSEYYNEFISRADMISKLTANEAVGFKFYQINDAASGARIIQVVADSNISLYSIGLDVATGETGTYNINTDVFTPIVVSGTPTLSQVLTAGNTSGANDIQFDATQGLLFANTSRLREGTIDAGLGGTKGIAQICAVGYELKWEAGRLYVMGDGGTTIRLSLYNFATPPTPTDDSTKGYAAGSRWILDDGTVYTCLNAVSGIWVQESNIPDLQQVTDAGATTTVGLTVDNGTESVVIKHDQIKIVNALGADAVITSPTLATTTNFEIPNKAGGTETFAMLSDISAGGGDMLKSTYDINNDGIVDSAQAMVTQGRNSTGATLYKGTIVYISGATGQMPNFVKAQANSEATSAGTFGVVNADIANNSNGWVTTIGLLDNIDTRTTATHPFTDVTLAIGDTIYLHPTVAGYITNVKPYAPYHLVYVGKVVNVGPSTQGAIVYRIQNGYELDELHDVSAQTPANKNGLFYNSSTSLWEARAVAATDIDANVSNTEFGYLDGLSSNIQTQINGKEPAITTLPISKGGTNSGTALSNNRVMQSSGGAIVEASAITAARALISDANGIPTHSTVTSTTLAFLDASSSIQTQLNNKVTVFASAADGAASSGITSTISISVLIPANTFAVDDVIRINHRVRATGVAGIRETRIYANTTSSLTGAILISTSSFAATILAGNNQRYLAIKNATTNTEVVNATTSLLSDYNNIPSPASVSTLAINWTADQYIIFQVNAANAADSIRATMYSIEKL